MYAIRSYYGKIVGEQFPLRPHVIPQAFDLVSRRLDRPDEGIVEPVRLLQHDGLVEILLVPEELVESYNFV